MLEISAVFAKTAEISKFSIFNRLDKSQWQKSMGGGVLVQFCRNLQYNPCANLPPFTDLDFDHH